MTLLRTITGTPEYVGSTIRRHRGALDVLAIHRSGPGQITATLTLWPAPPLMLDALVLVAGSGLVVVRNHI